MMNAAAIDMTWSYADLALWDSTWRAVATLHIELEHIESSHLGRPVYLTNASVQTYINNNVVAKFANELSECGNHSSTQC